MSSVQFADTHRRFSISVGGRTICYTLPKDWGPPGETCRRLAQTISIHDVFCKDVCELGGGYYAVFCGVALLSGAKSTTSVEAYKPASDWANRCYYGKFQSLPGDSLDVVGDRKFDFIIGNLPQMPVGDLELDERDRLYQFGGIYGFAVIQKYLDEAASYLKPGGKLQLAIGDWFSLVKHPFASYTVSVHPNNPLRRDSGYAALFRQLFPESSIEKGLTFNVYDYTLSELKEAIL